MKKVLILGASSDIGIEILKKFSKERKFKTFAHYSNGSKKFFNFIKNKKNISKIKFNFDSESTDLEEFVNQKVFNDIDIFINAAANLDDIPYDNFSAEDFKREMNINLLPGIMFTKKIGNSMYKKKGGSIIHLSSIGVKYGGSDSSFLYSLSKSGLEFMPKKIKLWGKNNVFVNTIRIGVTDTKIHKKIKNKNLAKRVKLIPLKRMAKPSEVADFIFYVATKNTFITNEVLSIAGGE